MKIQNFKISIDRILRIIEIMAVVFGTLLIIIQIKDLRNTNYGLTSLELTRDLYSDKTYSVNPKIIKIIHEEKSLLKINGGPISDEELNNFLGLMEWIDSANDVGILNEKIIYEMFSVDILAAFRNKEIQEYINQTRKDWNDGSFSLGFENMAKRMELLEIKNNIKVDIKN